jgi:DNA-binding GntR family transcriptional regulator
MTRWQDVADQLREQIGRGHYPPGSLIPKITDLTSAHQVSRITVRKAIAQLSAEGLVEPVRRRGTIVRDRSARQRITRSRTVYRDEIGYYFDPVAQPWRALRAPAIGWGPAPYDIAPALGVAAGTEILIRDRVMGDPATGLAIQLATSYLPADLARGTILADIDTGPGGIYDRLEEMGYGPLTWHEAVSARMPTPDEADLRDLRPGIPVLRIVRTTQSPLGLVLEINDTRLNAEHYEIGYPITRDPSATPAPPSGTDPSITNINST